MKRMGWMVAAILLCAAPAAVAQSLTGGGGGSVTGGGGGAINGGSGITSQGGLTVGVFDRTINGRSVRQGFVLRNRGNRKKRSALPYCRRGLFGRIVNKTQCRERRRSGLRY